MEQCPKCKTQLKQVSIVKYKDYGGAKVIGMNLFCPNRKCDYSRDENIKVESKPRVVHAPTSHRRALRINLKMEQLKRGMI